MEFQNEMYKILTSNNHIMLNVTFLLFLLILVLVSIEFMINVFEMKISNGRKVMFIISTFISVFITRLMVPIPLYRIICTLIISLLIFFILKQNIEKAILASSIVNTMLLVGEILFSKLFKFIYSQNNFLKTLNLNSNTNANSNILIFSLIILFSLIVLVTIVYFIFKKFNIKINIRNNLNSKERNIIILKSIFCMFIIFLTAVELLYFKNNLLNICIIGTFIILESYCIKDISNTCKLEESNIKIKALKEHVNNLNVMYDDIRSFKHDFSNIVQALGGYIITENVDGLKDMYSRLLVEIKQVNNRELLNSEIINNPSIYNILNSKYCKADSYNINMNLEVLLDLNELEINTLDLCRILGILLDNAIEAAKECDKKEISIRFIKDYKLDRNLIIIENTYKNLDVDISKMFDKEYTSKSEKKSHGLGLWRVKKILDRNNNLNLQSYKGDKFIQQLEIYNSLVEENV